MPVQFGFLYPACLENCDMHTNEGQHSSLQRELLTLARNGRSGLKNWLIMDDCLHLQGNYSYSAIRKWLTASPRMLVEKSNYLQAYGWVAVTTQTVWLSLSHKHKPVLYLLFSFKSRPVKMPNKFLLKYWPCCLSFGCQLSSPPPTWQPGFVLQSLVSACHVLCLKQTRWKEKPNL